MRLFPALAVLLAYFACLGCNSSAPKDAPAPSEEAAKVAAHEANGTGAAQDSEGADKNGSALSDKSSIAWVENDYSRALALAKKESKPIVIDMWAGWCHTCLSMKKSVLSDAGLSSVADDFVWLAVDTENPDSSAAMAKFPPKVWPTFFVVSPESETVQATQLGSCSVADFRSFLGRGGSGHLAQLDAGGKLPEGSPLAHLRKGDRQWQGSDYAGAAESYAAALLASEADWSHRGPTIKNQISALAKLKDKKACATLGATKLDEVLKFKSSASTDFIYYASTCADALSKDKATRLRIGLVMAMDMILADESASLSYDDRSDALSISRALAEKLTDSERAKRYARVQQKLLAKAVSESRTALEEMTYVWHQVEVHAFLGEGEAILAWVESLETRLPKEYDPPYRKAWLLAKMKRNAEAHAALQVALPMVKGARRGRLLSLAADLYKAEKNSAKEKETREAVLTHYQSLPPGFVSQKKIDAAKKALGEMDKS